MTKIRKAYEPRQRVALSFEGVPVITEQSHKSMTLVDNILRQYDKTGLVTHVSRSVAQYGDFTQVNEYQESLNRVIAAQDAFDALPSNIRKRFHNDPGEFFEFATNPDNLDELRKLGLAQRQADEKITKVQVVNQEPTANAEA